jgi:choline kinase
MKEPILVIMAAGMGSRYGGLKQIDPVGQSGEIIMDYSLYDAIAAGFKKVIFIIKDTMADDFKNSIGKRWENRIETAYAVQDLHDLPEGFTVPEGREKPWGTGHAVLAARSLIDGPFAVINADDYYGREAYRLLHDYLKTRTKPEELAMCVWQLNKTTSEHGHVARGVCEIEGGFLRRIVERTNIVRDGDHAKFSEDDGKTWTAIAGNTPVSMNFWGYPEAIVASLISRFPAFLEKAIADNPFKGEYLLPTIVDELIRGEGINVRAFPVSDSWFGVTYREDKPVVEAALKKLHEAGVYPTPIWA